MNIADFFYTKCKNMRKKLTLLIASLAFLLGSSTIWAQIGVLLPEYLNEQVTPRRGDATSSGTIKEIGRFPAGGAGNINNEFGAGESATIRGIKVIAPGTAQQTILKPSWQASEDIQIGSEFSKNIVILSFNSKGYASGWVNITCYGESSSVCIQNGSPKWLAATDPATGWNHDGTFYGNTKDGFVAKDYINSDLFIPSTREVSYSPSGFKDPYTGEDWTSSGSLRQWQLHVWNNHGRGLYLAKLKSGDGLSSSGVWTEYFRSGSSVTVNDRTGFRDIYNYPKWGTHAYFYFSEDKPIYAPYTSLAVLDPTFALEASAITGGGTVSLPDNYSDDGVPLIQVKGDFIQNQTQYDNSLSDGSKHSDINNDNTANTLNSAYLNNYKRPTTVAIDGTTTVSNLYVKNLNWWYDRYDARYFQQDHYLGEWSMAGGCCHVDNLRAWANNVSFQKLYANDGTSNKGANLLDAAIQLIDGAIVCVKNDVKDLTGNIASSQTDDKNNTPDYSETNALIVLPVADRMTLRVKGDFQANMHHERGLATNTNLLYTATTFPDPDPDIYLYAGTTPHTFASGNLDEYSNSSITTHTINAPASSASSSIFGVYGNYQYAGNMAYIHTDTARTSGFNGKNPGVIEVGPNTAGKKYYNVYSWGILKNFESCNLSGNFTMNFGNTFGDMAHLAFTEKEPLYILNYGNNGSNGCDADIRFYQGSTDSIANAYTNATDEGALQIQALSDVEFRATTTINNVQKKGNNLYVLSDGGNIVTQKFDITSEKIGDVGEGLITFWTEDRLQSLFSGCANNDGNRNALRGNIYMNDSVKVTRTDATTPAGTETNLIAANNIRTAMFDFNSTNTADDTTNIISRKGDIYLGYSVKAPVYSGTTAGNTNHDFNTNRFKYNITDAANAGVLNIKAGYDDQSNTSRLGGGNIYFTHIEANMMSGGNYPTNITIPFSNEYRCGVDGELHLRTGNSMVKYEHAGIIGGVGRCGTDSDWNSYGRQLIGNSSTQPDASTDTSLFYRANNGNLLVDAGLHGNIIMNQGSYLDFQGDGANAVFRTRSGDIDMRGQTNIDGLMSSILFLASSDDPNKLKTGICDCKEQQNNVYLQDMQQRMSATTKGSIFIGADNNIKLQYGGLKNIGTRIDPFLSEDKGYDGKTCGTSYHCDADTMENKARDLILNFRTQNGQGGMGIVASDLIDIYKDVTYIGGNGPGMSTVPTYNTLHGEAVAGYGLYIKSQGNKDNWTKTDFDVLGRCGRNCDFDDCTDAFLHQTARVTFHADAHLYPENQRIYIGSPVLDIYGNTELNTTLNKGNKTSIMIQTDSLILHDSLIVDGTLTKFNTWSNLYRNMPVIKLGHQRFTPPFVEDGTTCKSCYIHEKTTGTIGGHTALDSIFVTFRNGATIDRLHTLVADHAVISFLTDSFDNVKGDPVINAKFYTDTFKVRNHVELYKTADHTHDGHFELISEPQMGSKSYAGIYARHLHMEPVHPDCRISDYSQLWLQDPALNVITSSTFGGFGTIHADVHVEIQGKLAPGYASLGKEGRCYEQKAGTLTMQDLRMDRGAEIHYSIGNIAGFEDELTDCIVVDELTLYGNVNVFVEKRICQDFEPGCYPIIRYKSEGIDQSNLNNLQLGTRKIDGYNLALDTSIPGVVYLCVGEVTVTEMLRGIYIPEVPGATTDPEYGEHYVVSQENFTFTVKYDSEPPLRIRTGRIIEGKEEILIGTKNENGEYVYVIRQVTQSIVLTFGPDYETSNDVIDGTTVWSNGNTIYINVNREDIASIYSVTGQLVKRIELPEGSTSIPMERGIYIVTLKDGSVHKVILK